VRKSVDGSWELINGTVCNVPQIQWLFSRQATACLTHLLADKERCSHCWPNTNGCVESNMDNQASDDKRVEKTRTRRPEAGRCVLDAWFAIERICLVSENAGGKAVAVLICGLFSARLINWTGVQCPSDTIWFFHQSNRLIYPPAGWLARQNARGAGCWSNADPTRTGLFMQDGR